LFNEISDENDLIYLNEMKQQEKGKTMIGSDPTEDLIKKDDDLFEVNKEDEEEEEDEYKPAYLANKHEFSSLFNKPKPNMFI